MKYNSIKCDACGKEIVTIMDRKEFDHIMVVDGIGNIISSTEPTYITINLSGHGIRSKLNREYDICEECLHCGVIIDQIEKELRIYGRSEVPRNEQ